MILSKQVSRLRKLHWIILDFLIQILHEGPRAMQDLNLDSSFSRFVYSLILLRVDYKHIMFIFL